MAQAVANVLAPSQTLLVWALLAKQGYAAQKDLGVTIDASERDALEKSGLVSQITREHTTVWLRLEDAGWAWAQEHLTKALPPNQTVLHNMMVRIDAHLKAKGETLVDLIGNAPKAGSMDPELTGVVDA